MENILTIVGPTGVGKTKLAITLAKKLKGEIISADSRQVYRHLNIGTAKPTREERNEIPFHLIDIVEPDQSYSCGQFALDAEDKLEEIRKKGHLPIVCGGTGLYIRALFEPLHSLPQSDKKVREKLLNILKEKGLTYLHQYLLQVDPQWAEAIKPNDKQRILRGLEVYEITGRPLSSFIKGNRPLSKYKPYYIGLDLPRPELYKKIDERFERMIRDGLVDEVQNILKMGFGPDCNGLRTIGYKEIVAYIQNRLSLSEAIDKAKKHTRNLARRQITWFRKIPDIKWYSLETPLETILPDRFFSAEKDRARVIVERT